MRRGSKELSEKKTNFFWINLLEMQWNKGVKAERKKRRVEIQKEKVRVIIRCVSDLVSDQLKSDTECRVTVRNETKEVFPFCHIANLQTQEGWDTSSDNLKASVDPSIQEGREGRCEPLPGCTPLSAYLVSYQHL